MTEASAFPEVDHFRDESEALYALLAPLDDEAFEQATQFKDWTLHDVIAHLHIFNYAADLSMQDGEAFVAWYADLGRKMAGGKTLIQATEDWLEAEESGARNRNLLDVWRGFYLGFAARAAQEDPKKRVQWAGPEMSVRMSVTARLMETWAHGQEVYDHLGKVRVDTDRIHGIATLGVKTYGWTFINRKIEVPQPPPYVRLTAPSGTIWEWNEPQDDNRVEGSATEFCQVVTQTRNFVDTELVAVGDPATRWMSIAQCFAGPPEDPPKPGTRGIDA